MRPPVCVMRSTACAHSAPHNALHVVARRRSTSSPSFSQLPLRSVTASLSCRSILGFRFPVLCLFPKNTCDVPARPCCALEQRSCYMRCHPCKRTWAAAEYFELVTLFLMACCTHHQMLATAVALQLQYSRVMRHTPIQVPASNPIAIDYRGCSSCLQSLMQSCLMAASPQLRAQPIFQS